MTNIRPIFGWLCLSLLMFLLARVSPAQQAPSTPLKLETAVELALQNYPAIRAAQAQADAAGEGVEQARHAYLPRLEIDWQQTRGTRNNIFGQFFPQPGVMPISGPALPNSSFTESVWGSAGGLIMSWEPFDFGLRRAGIGLANRITGEAQAKIAVTRLDVAAGAADAFLTVIAADQAVRAAQANVERMETFSRAVHVLVDNQLRPGADASRTDVELAAARSVMIQAKQQAAIARVVLAEAIGMAGQPVTIDAGVLSEPPLPPSLVEPLTADLTRHPLALLQQASLETILARQQVVDRSFFPRFNWQTAVFGRGSGARVDGQTVNNRGFYPDTANWAIGLTISFAPTDIFNWRTRRHQEASNLRAEQARYDQTMQRLKADEAKAHALIDAARELAQNTPQQLQAAQETELRVRKRYEAELGTVTEVAETQRLLAQAEVDHVLARLSVWRALLAEAKAKGDLKPFLELLQNAQQKRN